MNLILQTVIPGIDEPGMRVAARDVHADGLATEAEEEEPLGNAVDDDVEGVERKEMDICQLPPLAVRKRSSCCRICIEAARDGEPRVGVGETARPASVCRRGDDRHRDVGRSLGGRGGR